MQCPSCRSMVQRGAKRCPYCRVELDDLPPPQRRVSKLNQLQDKFSSPSSPHVASSLRQAPEQAHPNETRNEQRSSQGHPLSEFFVRSDTLDNKFQLIEEIGRGGMGFVYRATDLSLKREVAVKILPPHYNDDEAVVSRFQREARAMASLDHHNIVTVYSIGHDQGLHYFVMKLLKGQTLAQLLKRIEVGQHLPLEVPQSLDYLIQACNGLEHAHSKSLLHRDIKPGNLMLSAQGALTIMDFGIVKRLDDTESVGLKTAHGKIFGTPEYMPPEQAMGKGDYSPASDLYALAIVGYELLCGRLPYFADTPIGIIIQHIRAEIPGFVGRAENRYPLLEAIFKRALAKDPRDRFESAGSFRDALASMLRDIAAPTITPIDPTTSIKTSSTSTREDLDFDDIDSIGLDSDLGHLDRARITSHNAHLAQSPPKQPVITSTQEALQRPMITPKQEVSPGPKVVPTAQEIPRRPMAIPPVQEVPVASSASSDQNQVLQASTEHTSSHNNPSGPSTPDSSDRHTATLRSPSSSVPSISESSTPTPSSAKPLPQDHDLRTTQTLTRASARSGHYVNPLKRKK